MRDYADRGHAAETQTLRGIKARTRIARGGFDVSIKFFSQFYLPDFQAFSRLYNFDQKLQYLLYPCLVNE